MNAELMEVDWRRRAMLVLASGIIATLLGIGFSMALSHPAGAATLPIPDTPTLPVPPLPTLPVVGNPLTNPVTDPVSGLVGSASSLTSNAVTGVSSAAGGTAPQLPTLPLPTKIPVVNLPVPQLPGNLLPVTKPTGTLNPTGDLPVADNGLAPGTGGPAHGSKSKGSAGRSGSTRHGAGRSSSSLKSGSPLRTPGQRQPSLPVNPGTAGDALIPGHWGSPFNALPLVLVLFAGLLIGGVFLKRRFAPTLAYESRFAPPG
jgi:hypothetical protein